MKVHAFLQLTIFLLLSFSYTRVSANNPPLGQWAGIEGNYYAGKYALNQITLKLPRGDGKRPSEKWIWKGSCRDLKTDLTNHFQTFLTGRNTAEESNVACSITNLPLKSGAIKQDYGLVNALPANPAYTTSYMMVQADNGEIAEDAIHFLRDSLIERIIYEQKEGTQMNRIHDNFLYYLGNDKIKNDFRIVFMGNVPPSAFDKSPFKQYLKNTDRPLYLEFDLPKTVGIIQVLEQSKWEPIIKHRPMHKKFDKVFPTEDYMPKWVPRRTGIWYGPSITSPQWNKFTLNCSNPDNSWLKNYSLGYIPMQLRRGDTEEEKNRYRPLYFWCEDGKTDINVYKGWLKGDEKLEKVDGSADEGNQGPILDKTSAPIPPNQPGTTLPPDSGWWIYILIGLILIIVLVAVAVYFLVFNQPVATTGLPPSSVASNLSHRSGSPRASSVSGQQTARSGISSNQAMGRRVSGTSRITRAGSPSSMTGKSRSASRSASRMTSRPSASRSQSRAIKM